MTNRTLPKSKIVQREAATKVASIAASEVQTLIVETMQGLSLKDFIGTDTDLPEFPFLIADQEVSARAGLTRLQYGEAIDDAVSYIEKGDLSDATRAAIESAEADSKVGVSAFDWRASFEEHPREAAAEIRTIVRARIWDDARPVFEAQLAESLTEVCAEQGIDVIP